MTSVLVITGAVGAGKTAVAYAAGDLLAARGVPHAVVDFDALTELWPAPPDDPFNGRVGLRNLAAVWRNYAAAGAERLVVAAVIERRDERDEMLAAAGGGEITVCRLLAPVPLLQRRVAGRETGAARAWHVARAAELSAILDAAAVEDFAVSNDERPLDAVAGDVLAAAGWPG